MKKWEKRFFDLDHKTEVELKGACFSDVFSGLEAFQWKLDDEFWARDLQVSRLLRDTDEIFVIQETFFDPQLIGAPGHIEELRKYLSGIDPNEVRYA